MCSSRRWLPWLAQMTVQSTALSQNLCDSQAAATGPWPAAVGRRRPSSATSSMEYVTEGWPPASRADSTQVCLYLSGTEFSSASGM
jgi:hypothetical protein